VVVVGTLSQNLAEGAYAHVDAGTRPFVGVPFGLDGNQAWLRPDGGLIYRHPSTQRIMAAVPDRLGFTSSGWAYPPNIENDLDVTPGCPQTPTRFLLRPSGSVVAQCQSGEWFEGSTALPHLTGQNVVAFARNGVALVSGDAGVVLLGPSGPPTPVSAPFTPTPRLTRSTPQGFFMAGLAPMCSLYRVDLSGQTTKVGDYSSTGIAITPLCLGRLDASGTLFFPSTTVGGVRVIRRPLEPATLSVAFDNTASTTWDFGPRFRLIVTNGADLVSAP
jgi:hypothetical protein